MSSDDAHSDRESGNSSEQSDRPSALEERDDVLWEIRLLFNNLLIFEDIYRNNAVLDSQVGQLFTDQNRVCLCVSSVLTRRVCVTVLFNRQASVVVKPWRRRPLTLPHGQQAMSPEHFRI